MHSKPRSCMVAFLVGMSMMITNAVASETDSIASDSLQLNKGRLTGVIIAQSALYVTSLTGLYYAWYKDYPQSSFHFFNDSDEWMQVDKCGHMTTANYISRLGYSTYRWSGVPEKKAVWFGGMLGFVYLLNIEMLDAFSAGWGFSVGDLAANTLGSGLFITQQLLWKEQRFSLKYSFHPSDYARYNPDALGENLAQQMIKDYNGQTYWLSGNISSFLPKGSRFPRWLNISVGYGAEGMTGGFTNPEMYQGQPIPDFTRYRKFFLSVDADLTRIPTRSAFLKTVFLVLSFIKIPAPALEINTLGEFRAYPLYF